MESSAQDTLALLGGMPVLKEPLPPIHNVGKEELAAVERVLTRGPLSGFIGTAGERFLGGPEVRRLEQWFIDTYGVKYAVSFNSGTTALHGAIASLEIGPGDEVIVPPYSMAASATCVINNGAVPIFADIDPQTFTIDPKSIEERITPYTKAIVVVHLFGQAAAMDEIMAIAAKHNLKVIEDNAQSPLATYNGKYTGTFGDVAMFSLNVNKTAQAGEGGVLVTNDERAALRARLLRNHGESVVDDLPDYAGGPIFGSNYRMTEVEAAIAYEQCLKLQMMTKKKIELCEYVTEKLKGIEGLTVPYIPATNTHVYFQYVLKIDEATLGISRNAFVDALAAEGFPMSKGYVRPIYLLHLFQEKKAYNHTHFPFEFDGYNGKPDYSKGICPVVERMYEKEVTTNFPLFQYSRTAEHMDLFVEAIHKILRNREALSGRV